MCTVCSNLVMDKITTVNNVQIVHLYRQRQIYIGSYQNEPHYKQKWMYLINRRDALTFLVLCFFNSSFFSFFRKMSLMFIEDGKKIDDMSPSIDNITLLVTVIRYSFPLFVTNDHVLENTSNDVILNTFFL
jgi:hypothetical protein